MRRGGWMAAALGIGGLVAPTSASARFVQIGDVLRGVNLVATVSVEGAGEQTQRRSDSPLPFDTGPFSTEQRVETLEPEGRTQSAAVHASSFTVAPDGSAFEGSSCSGGELETAIADPGTGSSADGSVESFYELYFRIEDEPEPFELRYRLQSELSALEAAGSSQLSPRATVALEETLNDLPIVAASLADASADGIVVDTQRVVRGLLAPGEYRLEAAVEVAGRATTEGRGDGLAIYEVDFMVPEPDPMGALPAIGLLLAWLGRRAYSSPMPRCVRCSCSR